MTVDRAILRARLAGARRRLETVSGDPREGRRELLASLRSVVPSEFALEYRAVHGGDRWRVSADAVLEGSSQPWIPLVRDWAGSTLDPEVHSYDPELPDPAEANRFTGLRPKHHRLRSYQRYYQPHGLTQLRTLCYDGARFLGWVGLMRGLDAPDFNAAERRALDSLSPVITSSLASLHQLERSELCGVAPAHLVMSPTGRLTHATRELEAWLTPARRAFLSDFVRAADRGQVHTTRLDGAALAVRRLVGAQTVYLVNLRRARLPRRCLLATLAGRRRQVAEYAAAGATAKEIAQTLQISAHTVRQHLKVVYRELGVGSRVELARALESEVDSRLEAEVG